MKKAFITVPIIVILIAAICTSFILMNKKPVTSHINTAQKIAAYSKPAVVRIVNYAVVKWTFNNSYDYEVVDYFAKMQNQSIVGGSGSGATINSSGYIVTNAHVVELSKMEDQDIADIAFDQLCTELSQAFNVTFDATHDYMLKYTLWESVQKGLLVVLPGGEVLDGEIKSYGAPIGEGKDVAVVKIEAKNLPTLKLGDSDKVQLQDNIWVFGYPGAAESDLLSPDSSLVVTITDGKISATDKKSAQGAAVLQVSAAATHGNSGGPVMKEDGTIIGLLTFRGDTVNGQEIQGFNFIVPVNTVKEFVGQSGASNDEGTVDRLYREGLELYWGGYYKDALLKFEEVQRLYSNHPEIKKLISESQSKSSDSKILWSKYKSSFIIFDAAAGLIIIVLLVFTFIIRPKKVQVPDSQQIMYYPYGDQGSMSQNYYNQQQLPNTQYNQPQLYSNVQPPSQPTNQHVQNTYPVQNYTQHAQDNQTQQNMAHAQETRTTTPIKPEQSNFQYQAQEFPQHTDTQPPKEAPLNPMENEKNEYEKPSEFSKKTTISINGVSDLNNDGVVDIQDIIIALQKQMENKDNDKKGDS